MHCILFNTYYSMRSFHIILSIVSYAFYAFCSSHIVQSIMKDANRSMHIDFQASHSLQLIICTLFYLLLIFYCSIHLVLSFVYCLYISTIVETLEHKPSDRPTGILLSGLKDVLILKSLYEEFCVQFWYPSSYSSIY